MKILPQDRYYNDIIPINIIYNRGQNITDDDITIVYKDLQTGEKKVHIEKRPTMDVYIVKPEFRTYTHIRNFMEISQCYPLRVHYATRYAEIAKELGLKSSEDARESPYVFGADTTIEQYYMTQFEYEYHTDAPKNLSRGYFDIENDTINLDRFPMYGETPINAVTYIDDESHNVFTFVLTKNNLIELPIVHVKHDYFQQLSEKFDRNMEWLKTHTHEFIQKCHEWFDESYPGFEYNVMLFDDEISLIRAFWQIVHAVDNDFVSAWNLPYDMQNMMERPGNLGYDVNDIIPDPRLGKNRKVFFKEDNNPVVHKKKHQCVTWTIPNFVDDMVNYAGIRSGGPKLQSNKLNYCAQKELQDEKLNYSEAASIRTLPYEDLILFILYNIKDVLLLVGIGRHTKDMDTIYSRMYSSMILPKDSFTTTLVVWGALKSFVFKQGYTFGANKNKFKSAQGKGNVDYASIVGQFDDDDEGDIDINLWYGQDKDDDDDEQYDGAFVMNTLHQQATGYHVLGKPSKYIHRWVADEDITSEYPSAIVVWNISNETLVGKVFLESPGDFDIPIYNSFNFRGDDLSDYKMDVSNFMMECYSERDILTFGSVFLNLPTPDKVLCSLNDCIEELEA